MDPTTYEFRVPVAADDTVVDGDATVTLDMSGAVCAVLRFGVNLAGTQVFNVGPDTDVTVSSASGELISVGYLATTTTTINQTGGLVKAFRSDGNRMGEVRIGRASGTTATYNLSGGTLDTEILREGGSNYPGKLVDTGGTIVIRTAMRQFGSYFDFGTGNYNTWTQGSSTFAPGGVGTISPVVSTLTEGTIYIGWNNVGILSGSYSEAYRSSSGTVVAIDVLDSDSYDNIKNYGYCSLGAIGDALALNFSYTPALNDTFDIWKITKDLCTGSGYFDTVTDNLPGYFNQLWVDVESGITGNETLRLTYVPEPTTLVLLGIGSLIAARRRK
jgi:hypothetical protein